MLLIKPLATIYPSLPTVTRQYVPKSVMASISYIPIILLLPT